MANELKVYKEQTMVKLFDWSVVVTTAPLDNVLNALNWDQQFIMIWGEIVNIRNVAGAKKQSTTDIDMFILNQSNPEVRERLRDIVDTRTKMWLKTNWVKHLVEIYESRFEKL